MNSEKRKVLEMLETGTITADEANRLLEALGGDEEAPQVKSGAKVETGNKEEYAGTFGSEQVTNIDISWISGPVELRVYGGEEINVNEYSNRELSEDEKLDISFESGRLQIRWSRRPLQFGLFIFSFLSKRLVVEIPEKMLNSIDNIYCKNTSGNVIARDLRSRVIDLSSTSGGLDVANVMAERLTAKSVSGSVNVGSVTCTQMELHSTSGSITSSAFEAGKVDIYSVSGRQRVDGGKVGEINCKSTSGTIHADLFTCPNTLTMNTVSGSIKVNIPENDGFTAVYSSTSGNFKTDFSVIGASGKSGNAVYASGKANFKFRTVSGSIKLSHR